MNVAELAERVAADQGVDKKHANGAIEAALKLIVEAAIGSTEVSLAAFGKFHVHDRPEREGRNPAAGETFTIEASRRLAFTPAKAALNGHRVGWVGTLVLWPGRLASAHICINLGPVGHGWFETAKWLQLTFCRSVLFY